MDPIQNGARQAILNCLKVKRGEKVVIVTDRETERLADALVDQINEVGAEVRKFVMEEYGDRPEDGSNPLKLPEEIKQAMAEAQVSVYIAQGKKGELHSFRIPLTKLTEEYNIRHGHMPGFNETIMTQGMNADYAEIQKLSAKVYDVVSKAKEIRVTSPAGTDFTAKFDLKYKWVVCDGNIKPAKWSNLPDGEVFTVPADANGTVVVDGVFGDFFTEKYGDIQATPLKYELKDGRCMKGSVECANQELKKEFEHYTFDTDENSDRLGEFAIGTNIGLTELIGNLLQDEKFPGVHIALGDAYKFKTGAEWESNAHNDGVLRNPTIIVDGKIIMENGKFLI